MNSYTILKKTPVGDLLLVANERQLTGIYFQDHKHGPKLQNDWKLDPQHPVLQQASQELREYFAGTRTEFSIPPCFGGTDFQNEIWRQIARIPFGETITYSELAERAGAPIAVRAVGTATGQNPLSIIVPCHRVIGKNGSMTGYAGGLDRKRRLLESEMKPMTFQLKQAKPVEAAVC